MSTTFDRVLLFPGQGVFRDGELAQLAARFPQVRQVFDDIDRVAHRLGAEGPGPHVLADGGFRLHAPARRRRQHPL